MSTTTTSRTLHRTCQNIQPQSTVVLSLADRIETPHQYFPSMKMITYQPVIVKATFLASRGQHGLLAEVILQEDALRFKAGDKIMVDAIQILP